VVAHGALEQMRAQLTVPVHVDWELRLATSP
jgi:hypothetical protein